MISAFKDQKISLNLMLSLVFFFQAEDGIRDGRVTGVQTCALPISEETIRLLEEARVFKENLKAAFAVNRKIANTAIGRDVGEILGQYPLPTLASTITQIGRASCRERV